MTHVPILHADEHLLVVDKPADVLVVPAPGRAGRTVVDLLRSQLGAEVFAVHRLDEATTGALVVARTEAARSGLEALFADHAVERAYLALVTGTPSPGAGRIESRLDETADVVRVALRGGRTAITRYETLARRGRFSLVQCWLETGRRNQIRVHMQALGCPLAGDRKYGFRARAGERFLRPLLHSWRLRFAHPLLPTAVAVEASPPDPLLQP